MSEVKRYIVGLHRLTDAAGQPAAVKTEALVVLSADFDAQRLRADTAEAELKLIRDALGIDPRHHVGKTTADGIKDLADAYVRAGETEHELRKDVRLWKDRTTSLTHKLAAAEHRIADTVAKLELAVDMLDDDERGNRFAKVLKLAIAALNQKSEGESHE